MAKKTELPENFDVKQFLNGDSTLFVKDEQSTESTEKVKKIRKPYSEGIDEEAIKESIAKMNISNTIAQKKEQTLRTENIEPPELNSLSVNIEETVIDKLTKKTSISKQRRTSLQEYQQTFLSIPKIIDRKTVFISSSLREKIVSINLRFGTEKSSVSGFIENLVIHHLEEYEDDLEKWKKL